MLVSCLAYEELPAKTPVHLIGIKNKDINGSRPDITNFKKV
jgi:hypothetical protein